MARIRIKRMSQRKLKAFPCAFLALLLGFLIDPSGARAVMLDNVAHSSCGAATGDAACGGTATSTTLTYSLNVGSGVNRALVVFAEFTCGSSNQSDMASVAYAGTSLTKTSSRKSADGYTYMDIWALPAGTQPTSGSNNVVVTFNSSGCSSGVYSFHSAAISATHVNQATTFTNYVLNDDGNTLMTSASLTLPSSGVYDLVVSYVCQGTSVGSTAQNLLFTENTSNRDECDTAGAATASGGTTSLSWSFVSPDYWEGAAVSFKDDGLSYAVQLVQSAANTTTASANSIALTVSATGSGNLLVVAANNNGTRTVTGVSDGTNAFTQASGAAGTNSAKNTDIWYLLKSTAGMTTITVTFSGSSGTFTKDAWFWEVTGFHHVAFDTAGHVNSGAQSGGLASGASVTTTGGLDFIVGVDLTNFAVTSNPKLGNAFISGGYILSDNDAASSLISQSAASYQPVWTDNGTSFTSSTAAFRETPLHRAGVQ